MPSILKLLHTADIHLGAKFIGLGARGAEQRRRLCEAFQDAVRLALEERVDLFLLAGDTFDQVNPSPESLAAFQQGLRQLAANRIPAVTIAGTHDCLSPNRLLPRLEAESEGALVLLGPERPVWEAPGLPAALQGVSLEAADSPERPLAGLRRAAGEGWRIGLAHAALEIGRRAEREARFSPEEVAATGLDYLALGHWHGVKDCSQGKVCAWYSGAPEMIALDETQSGSVLLVTLGEGQPVKVEPRKIGRRFTRSLTVAAQDSEAVTARALALADPNAVLELILTGLVTPATAPRPEQLESALTPHFFQVRVKDRTTLEVPAEELARYPETTVIGRFLRLVAAERQTASPERVRELDQALQLGLALLQGREVALWS